MDIVRIIQARIVRWMVLCFLVFMAGSFLSGCRLWGPAEPTLSDYEPGPENAAGQQEDPQILSLQKDPLWSEEGSLRAMVLSDLHYTQDPNQDHTLVPGIARAEGITDAILTEVIDRHPDVLIMTGDNTNSGYAADVSSLVTKLAKVKDHGIPVIVTTGNHDFDQMNAEEYEASYFPLLDPWFFSFCHAGTLAGHKEELTKDPFYRRMIRSLWNYNYGPWMKAMIESTQYSARSLELAW